MNIEKAWSTAPEWANYLTQDYEGWTFHEGKPQYDVYYGFYVSNGKIQHAEPYTNEEFYECYERPIK